MRVLVVKRDKLGDLLLTTALFAHWKAAQPNAELHLLANDYNAWVAREDSALSRIWIYPRARDGGRLRPAAAVAQWMLLWKLRRMRFDCAIAMGGDESPRAIRRAIATGARRVVAYARDPARYGPRLTDALPVPAGGHEIARMLGLLAPLGVEPGKSMPVPAYACPPEARAFARGWLSSRGLIPGRYIVLGIGARFACKQPSFEQIVRWSAMFHARWNLPTVFLWTPGASHSRFYPGDDEVAARVVAQKPPHLYPQRGTLLQALGLIDHAATSIMPDSGLMHFAAASWGGVVGLFANPREAGSAERWGPVGERARFVEAQRAVAEIADETIAAVLEPLVGRGVAIV